MTTLSDLRCHPWEHGNSWDENVYDLDQGERVRTAWDPTAMALTSIVAAFSDDDRWDGEVAAFCRLTDGRWLAFETFFGPTGDGFNQDAYGGDADVFIGTDRQRVIDFGLSDEARRRMGLVAS